MEKQKTKKKRGRSLPPFVFSSSVSGSKVPSCRSLARSRSLLLVVALESRFFPAGCFSKRSRREKILSPPPSRFEKLLISDDLRTGSFYNCSFYKHFSKFSRRNECCFEARLEKSNHDISPWKYRLPVFKTLKKNEKARATDETA